MQTNPQDWKARLQDLGFEFGPVWLSGYLDLADGTTISVGCGYGNWDLAKSRGAKARFPVKYYSDIDRKRYPDGQDLSRRKLGMALAAWIAAAFCDPIGLMDCVPAKHRTISASAAQTLLHCGDPRFRQWMNLNLWRVE